jgi:hypothetical protein
MSPLEKKPTGSVATLQNRLCESNDRMPFLLLFPA